MGQSYQAGWVRHANLMLGLTVGQSYQALWVRLASMMVGL